ncbi:MAG: hypothetical protein ACKOOG_06440, partial [Actinomycetota bacterium]
PVLDELLSARLRTAARRAAAPSRQASTERRRRLRSLRIAGAAAAVLVVCVGTYAVLGGESTGGGGTIASAPSRTVTVPRITGALELGEQADAAAAGRAALTVLADPPPPPVADPAGTASAAVESLPSRSGATAPGSAPLAAASPEVTDAAAACSDAARSFAATEAAPALVAGARVNGRLATVHAFGEQATVVIVVLDEGCRLLARTSATLPR